MSPMVVDMNLVGPLICSKSGQTRHDVGCTWEIFIPDIYKFMSWWCMEFSRLMVVRIGFVYDGTDMGRGVPWVPSRLSHFLSQETGVLGCEDHRQIPFQDTCSIYQV